MANTPDNVVAMLESMPQYGEWFQNAFPAEEEPVTFENMARAIEAFEATLLTPAPFDADLNGEVEALTGDQKAGLQLFIDKGCVACHAGVNVGGHGYYPFGLVERPGAEILPANVKDRYAVTATVDDEYVFRAAPLRNVAVTAPCFHSGVVWDPKPAVEIMAESQFGEDVTDQEADQIVAFLETLTGEVSDVTLPVLPPETESTPRPTSEVFRD